MLPAFGTGTPGASAFYTFELGTREVIDLSANSGAATLPLDIGFRAGTHILDPIFCDDNGIFRWMPTRDLQFRVIETAPLQLPRSVVDTTYYSQFAFVDDVFPVEVTPGSTLTVDIYLRVTANATAAVDMLGHPCFGASAFLDMDPGQAVVDQRIGGPPAADGIQLFFSRDSALVLAPRSGIVYAPVPEPDAFVGAASALAVLARRRTRRTSR